MRSIYTELGVFHVMRYINVRYLLTYLPSAFPTISTALATRVNKIMHTWIEREAGAHVGRNALEH